MDAPTWRDSPASSVGALHGTLASLGEVPQRCRAPYAPPKAHPCPLAVPAMVLLGPPVPTIYGMPIIAMPATAAMAALAAVARRLDLRPPNGGGRRTGP